jgi:hypothetical protein
MKAYWGSGVITLLILSVYHCTVLCCCVLFNRYISENVVNYNVT